MVADFLRVKCNFTKKVENINVFCSCRKSDADVNKTHFLAHYRNFQLVCHQLHAVKVPFYVKSVDVVTSGHMAKMAVKPFETPWPKTPCYMQTARLCLL